jgi:O-antigen/teichoic acid export membrane protein
VLLLFVAISIFVIYVFYFSMYLNFLKYQYFWDKKIAVQIFSFSGWNLWGGLSGFFTNTLVNTLINNNFGPIINASRSISLQVSNSLGAFVNNVLMGYRARIIRLYASGNRSAAIDLTISASRYCYYSTLIIVVPIACEMNYLMHVWIKEVPIYAVTFTQLMLFQKLIEVISYPFVILSHATGKIALYQTVVGVIQWMIFPVAWIFLLKFNNPTIIFCISILLSLVANIAQVYMINVVLKINNQVINFKKIFVNFFILFIYTVILALLLQLVIPEGGVRFMLSIIVTLTFGFMAIYRYSLEYSEKSYLVSVSKRIIAFNK